MQGENAPNCLTIVMTWEQGYRKKVSQAQRCPSSGWFCIEVVYLSALSTIVLSLFHAWIYTERACSLFRTFNSLLNYTAMHIPLQEPENQVLFFSFHRKFRMRKCRTCSQSIGHLECTRGEPSQCKDCFIPSRQIGVSGSPDKETGSSQHGSSDGSKEEGRSDLNKDGNCTCGICRAKGLLSSGSTAPGVSDPSPVAGLDMFSEQHRTHESSEKSSSSSFTLPLSPETEELMACRSKEMSSSASTSPSTGQIVNVRRKLDFCNSCCIKRMADHSSEGNSVCTQAGRHLGKESSGVGFDSPLPAAKRVKTGLKPIVNCHCSRVIPCIKINKLKAEDYLPFSKMRVKESRSPPWCPLCHTSFHIRLS